MKKDTQQKKIETPPLTPETILAFSKSTDDVAQLRKFIEELKRQNQRLLNLYTKESDLVSIMLKNYRNLLEENYRLLGIPFPAPKPEPKKEDDTFLYSVLN